MISFLQKPIFTGFAPNTDWSDLPTILSVISSPRTWQQSTAGTNYQKSLAFLRGLFSTPYVHLIDSGRSAIHLALQALQTKAGDEVLVPAYTCGVVINAIRAAGGIPVYVDVQDDLNLDPTDLVKKIHDRSTILLLQHTFGAPAKIGEIQHIAKAHGLKIIEDCAHALGGRVEGKPLGTFGDVAILSFGSDKVVSSVRGGALVTANQKLYQELQKIIDTLPLPTTTFTLRHLLHPLVFTITKPLYRIGIGKVLLKLSTTLGITAKLITTKEKQGSSEDPVQYTEALASLLYPQLRALSTKNTHREQIAQIYQKNLKTEVLLTRETAGIYLDFPIFVKSPHKVASELKRQGIMLGTAWQGAVVVPKDMDQKQTLYQQGSCPRAETLCQQVLLLPNHQNITISDAMRICFAINSTLKTL